MSDTIIHNDRNEMTGDHDANGAEALHEPNTVNIPGVVKFLTGLFVAVVASALLMAGLLSYFDARKAREAPPPSPLATGVRLPPQPRLQGAPGSVGSPAEDINRFRKQEDQMLDSYGWIDQQNGVIRIPIEQAKKLIEQRGLPVTPPRAPQGAAAQVAEKKR
ncbi:MAG TPA: hypothetical protein VFV58_36960 [Blastocatellia bacterium]|nr:hypothetical protein [Blastocatellia bacterium]